MHPIGDPGAAHFRIDHPGKQVQVLLGVLGLAGLLHGLENLLGGAVFLEVIRFLQIQVQIPDLQIPLLLINGAHLQRIGAAVFQCLLDRGGVVHIGIVAGHLDVLGKSLGGSAYRKGHGTGDQQDSCQ